MASTATAAVTTKTSQATEVVEHTQAQAAVTTTTTAATATTAVTAKAATSRIQAVIPNASKVIEAAIVIEEITAASAASPVGAGRRRFTRVETDCQYVLQK